MNSSSNPPTTNTLTPRRSRRWWFLGLLVVAAIAVAMLPTLAGSRWVYEPLLRSLQREDFLFRVDSVQLRWFQPLVLRGISVSQTTPKTADILPDFKQTDAPKSSSLELLSIAEVRSNRSLLSYLINGRNLGRIDIIEPKIDIELLENGTNLERLVRAFDDAHQGKKENKKKTPPAIDLDIGIRKLTVQVTSADGGNPLVVVPEVNGDISYRSLDGNSRVIVQPMTVLNHVVVTPELVRLGLGVAIPVLAKSAWFDGKVSLSTSELHIPLDNPTKSTGDATLTLHQLRSGPSEPVLVSLLDWVSHIRGKESQHELVFVDGSEIKVSVADERVRHSGMKAGLPKLDPRLQIASEGSVGLADRSLDLLLDVPVPIEQIARRESVQQLGVPSLKLPIRGTLDAPVVDWKSLRGDSATLLGMISGTLRNEAPGTSAAVEVLSNIAEGSSDDAIAATVDLIRQLRQRRQAAQESEDQKPSEENGPPDNQDSKERRPFRGVLRDLLRGGK
jgi:hypothetical protein